MSAVLVTLADAITAELNAATWDGLSLEWERSYADWEIDLRTLGQLKGDVVPVAYDETDLDGRGSVGYACSVDIGVRKKFGQPELEQCGRIDLAEIDRLVLFVQELHEFFIAPSGSTTIGRRLQNYTTANWRETTIRSTYSQKHLREMQMFLGVVRVTYDVSKTL